MEKKAPHGEMQSAHRYLQQVQGLLGDLERSRMAAITQAGELCARALLDGHQIYVSRASTHTVDTEITQRAGGFVAVHILSPDGSELNPGDVVIIASNAGTNSRTVDLALRCRALRVQTIAVSSVAFERSIRSTDPSGKLLHEVADVCIDLGGPVGDAALELRGLDVPILPVSGVLSVAAVWMVFAVAADRMVAAGKPPRVYQAVQMMGARERNERCAAEATRTGVGYTESVTVP